MASTKTRQTSTVNMTKLYRKHNKTEFLIMNEREFSWVISKGVNNKSKVEKKHLPTTWQILYQNVGTDEIEELIRQSSDA